MSRLKTNALMLLTACCFFIFGHANAADSTAGPTSSKKTATAGDKSVRKGTKVAENAQKKKQSTEECGCAKSKHDGWGSPPQCDCIQFLLQDYPGYNDLYVCYTFYHTCDEEGELNYWFGEPADDQDRPEICTETAQSQCEPSQSDHWAAEIPGHGLNLDAASAWNLVQGALQAAQNKKRCFTWDPPQYHTLPNMPLGIGLLRDVTILAVPIHVQLPGSKLNGKTIYMCVQIDSAQADQIVPVQDVRPSPSHGAQFGVKYKVTGEATERVGLVWLK